MHALNSILPLAAGNDRHSDRSPRSSQAIRSFHLLVVSDNRLMADAIAAALVNEGEVTTFESIRCGEEHTHLRRTRYEPQLLIIDACCVENLDGLFSKTNRLAEELPETHIAVLSHSADPRCVTGCIESGAAAFILKSEALRDVLETIRALKAGKTRCCSQVTALVLAKIRELSQTKSAAANEIEGDLTQREIEVLQLLERGLLNKEIARSLGVQLSTVKNHLSSIYQKLGVTNRHDAVCQALATGALEGHSAG